MGDGRDRRHLERGQQASNVCKVSSISGDSDSHVLERRHEPLARSNRRRLRATISPAHRSGEPISGESSPVECYHPWLGRRPVVVFKSPSTNLVPNDTNGVEDVLHDPRPARRYARTSPTTGAGQRGRRRSGDLGRRPVRRVLLDLVELYQETRTRPGAFVRDLLGEPRWQSLCFPGYDGTLGCPCGNDPYIQGSGCNNSASTGGAIILASGGTYLSSDTLVLRTAGEKPTATSVLLQGSGVQALGFVYGMGIRCVGGTMKRLFTKTASGGSITAPDFAAGDPTISARSAAKGDPLVPGDTRAYLVFYRDPIVLGGCPATSTFNTTQTGVVNWAP